MNFKRFSFGCLMVTALFLLTACGNGSGGDDTSETRFPRADMSAYDLEEEHRFFTVTMEEALELLEEEFEGIIYFGFPGCPYCQAAIPLMHEASQNAGVDIFYVSRAHDLREGEWLEWDAEMAWWLYNNGVPYMRWINEDGELVDVDAEEEEGYRPNINVPQIIHLREGAVVDTHRGTFEGHVPIGEGDARHLPELTDSEHATLLARYLEIFSAVGVCPLDGDADDCE